MNWIDTGKKLACALFGLSAAFAQAEVKAVDVSVAQGSADCRADVTSTSGTPVKMKKLPPDAIVFNVANKCMTPNASLKICVYSSSFKSPVKCIADPDTAKVEATFDTAGTATDPTGYATIPCVIDWNIIGPTKKDYTIKVFSGTKATAACDDSTCPSGQYCPQNAELALEIEP